MTLRLSDFLPFRLSVLSNTVSQRIADRYAADFSLNVPQWRVMAVLGETPGLSASQLTERTAMDKVAVSRAVSALIEAGRLRRTASETDGRRSLLHLTDEGSRLYGIIAEMAAEYERGLLAALDEKDRGALHRILEVLAQEASPERPLW